MDLLLRLQADLLGVPVRRTAARETTAVGAAYLAGLAEGVWASLDEIAAVWAADAAVAPGQSPPVLDAYETWHRAVERALRWEDPPG